MHQPRRMLVGDLFFRRLCFNHYRALALRACVVVKRKHVLSSALTLRDVRFRNLQITLQKRNIDK